MFNYIYQNQFVTSDEELTSPDYAVGNSLEDYIAGKYVILSEEQVTYMNEHPNASPEEVWEMHPLDHVIHVETPQDRMFKYFEEEHNLVYINNEVHPCWDHQQIIYNAECAKALNEEYFTFMADGKYFRGGTDDIIQMMRQIGLYYHKLSIVTNRHYRYLEKHPDEIGSYDYTTGFPEILHFTLEEVYDTD